MYKSDARPISLVDDEFLLSVRSQLVRDNMLDTRAIRVDTDGNWEVIKKNGSLDTMTNSVTIVDDDEGSDSEDSLPLRRKPRRLRDKPVNATKKVKGKIVIELND